MDSRRPQSVRILIADDHPIFRDGLRRLLEAESNLEYPEGFFSSHARRQRELEALRGLGWLGRVGFRIVKLLSGTRRE